MKSKAKEEQPNSVIQLAFVPPLPSCFGETNKGPDGKSVAPPKAKAVPQILPVVPEKLNDSEIVEMTPEVQEELPD